MRALRAVVVVTLVGACVKPDPYRCAVDECVPDAAVDATALDEVAPECVPGERLARAQTSCPAVCDRLPSCCDVSWTRVCVQLAETACDLACGGRVVFASTDAVDGYDVAVVDQQLVLTALPAFGTVGQSYRSVAWADFDRDRTAELLVTTATGNVGGDEMWVLHAGTSAWDEVVDLRQYGRTEAFEVGSGDYDDDGQLDVVMSGISPGLHLVHGRAPGVRFEIGADGPPGVGGFFGTSFDSGDYDNDGDDDLVVVDYSSGMGRIARWRDDRFEDGPAFGPFGSVRRVRFGDVDGDHDLDLAIAHGDEVKVVRTAGGLFETNPAPWTFTASGGGFTDAAWIDVEGDGDLDLAVIGDPFDGSILRVFDNTGTALDTQPRWFSVTRDQGWKLAVGDVDGDGDPDLALACDGTPNRIYRNDGDWSFSVGWTAPTIKPSYGVALTGLPRR